MASINLMVTISSLHLSNRDTIIVWVSYFTQNQTIQNQPRTSGQSTKNEQTMYSTHSGGRFLPGTVKSENNFGKTFNFDRLTKTTTWKSVADKGKIININKIINTVICFHHKVKLTLVMS